MICGYCKLVNYLKRLIRDLSGSQMYTTRQNLHPNSQEQKRRVVSMLPPTMGIVFVLYFYGIFNDWQRHVKCCQRECLRYFLIAVFSPDTVVNYRSRFHNNQCVKYIRFDTYQLSHHIPERGWPASY